MPAFKKSKRRPRKVAGAEFYNDAFRVKVEPEGDGLRIEASISSDRSLWMNSQRQVLSGKALKALHRLKWRIFVPHGVEKWPLTDNPALRLGFRSDSDFSFDGGWGQKKADLVMALTPRHLMFAEVGSRRAGTETLNLEMTRRLQKVILARAHRVIFATEPDSRIEQERPRVVDAAKFAAEREADARWHEGQSEIEREWAARKVIDVSDELLSQ